jgi:RNA polymerase sigma-70 factor (ECF subfamily)
MLRFLHSKPSQLSDRQLLERYQRSEDLNVLALLYERYVELVYGLCLKYLENEAGAEDAVMDIYQELSVKLLKHEVKSFRSWLYVFAKNHCLMKIRAQKKEPKLDFKPEVMHSLKELHPINENGADNPNIHYLKECVEELPDEQQNCIKWFYYEEKSYKDIADIEQIPLGKVRSYIQNGRRNLKNCVEQKSIKNESKG